MLPGPRLAELPAGVSWSPFAPRLEAHIGVLAGVYRLSRRQVRDVVSEIFGIPISTGAVDAAIMRMSVILRDPWEQLRASIQAASQVHADETGWRLRGAYECLWVATTALAACYRIDPHRSQAAAKELLGDEFGGFVICDRYVGYHWLDVLQQQLCWAHAIRQLIALSERQGAPGKLGKQLLSRPTAAISRTIIIWTGCAHSSHRYASRSRRCSRRAPAAATRRPRTSAPGCWRSTTRCGPSATFKISRSRSPTTPPKERSATPSFFADYRVAPNPSRAVGGSSGSSRSARRCASKTAQRSTT